MIGGGTFAAGLICLLFTVVVYAEKYKLCVVDGRGGFKRSGRYCPILDHPDSKVECVLGVDRLDCLRRISKGKVDFSVFTPEDLVIASNSEIEVLITNELRYTNDAENLPAPPLEALLTPPASPYEHEYDIVAVIDDNSEIKSRHDLREKKFCHPGYGYETDWTKILSNYFEASVVPQTCLPQLTITENRIKASSQFFKSACKAGPWVSNPDLDSELKRKYPNLCQLCNVPSKCSMDDKYWGRRGSLFCLTDGAGEVSWARLDDVKVHFGLVPGRKEIGPAGYSFLCPDGTTKPVNSTSPCVWVVKPWPVIATKRTSAQDIQEFVTTLTRADTYSWQTALLNLIEVYHLNIHKMEPLEAIESYLDRATGFLNANSFSGCHPPRTIRVCTTSIVENAKCAWLRESAAVYGIEPDLDCLKADNATHCMQALNDNVADLVMVPPKLLHYAINTSNLKSLFYETVNDDAKYLTVAITTNKTGIITFEDLKGRSVCFPEVDGVAWNSIAYTLREKNLLETCPLDEAVEDYFGAICAPGHNKSKCDGDIYRGEYGAIKCLINGKGDVAVLSKNSLSSFLSDLQGNRKNFKINDFHILCDETMQEGCHLSWSPLGQAMVRANSSDLWTKDTLDVFLQFNELFGKDYKSLTTPLQLFGLFDGKSDILFHDDTVRLKGVPTIKNFDRMPRLYESLIKENSVCVSSSSSTAIISSWVFILISLKVFM